VASRTRQRHATIYALHSDVRNVRAIGLELGLARPDPSGWLWTGWVYAAARPPSLTVL
jgi:hypothetical protein